MVKTYSREPPVPTKAAKASGADLRVHFKNTYNAARTLQGQTIGKAQAYLKDVIARKRCVPFLRYSGKVGRTAQAKEFNNRSQGRWPVKSAKILLGLLQNLEANATVKNLDLDKLVITHVQVNRAQKGRRRTYRAHGRIGPYLSSNCHVELWAQIKEEAVKKEQSKDKQLVRLSRKQIARQRVKVGENK